ncbi:hypothetical protein IG193_02395 [Infirmifilum lucidum]|uniref:Uncharacterized protein n=1 Tax=Infirmifilum lucidum TaxID=2776706 RepID=A0A7L9FJZ6_9CREN|nr:hypothetical protein [Infirmifilum lucidum]QOJ79333.1 hypothetical protein IG193_02395 [Infirmifilum lucidum]
MRSPLARLRISGELHKRVRRGRKVYRGFFVLIADGKMLMNLGRRNGSGGFESEGEIAFERVFSVVAKSGPSGLEGSIPDGGKWFVLQLAPSDKERRITLKLPILEGEDVRLELTGFFDVVGLELCSDCSYTEFIELEP